VELYKKYKGRVQFVIIDLDQERPPAQDTLVHKYFEGYIPHVVVVDRFGRTLYSQAGEVDEDVIERLLDKALSR
jgi:thioredoxin-like negative regulator of GroEL